MKRKITNSRLIELWLDFHPYDTLSSIDKYYLRVCGEVYDILKRHESKYDVLEVKEMEVLACILTGYFEDVISDVGLWQAFTSEHYRLYNKYIPFYTIDDDYYQDEINEGDVAFLIWHFFNQSRLNKELLSPQNSLILELAHRVFSVYDREYEKAIENKRLKDFYTLPDDEDDYYLIKDKIWELGLNSYLHYFHGLNSDNEVDAIYEHTDFDPEQLEGVAYDIRDNYIMEKSGALLAYRPSEWLAHIAGPKHPMYQDLKNISSKKKGYFFFIKEDKDHLWFRHIVTGYQLPVTRESMKNEGWKPESSIILLGVVRWKGEWWLSGIASSLPYNPDLVEQIKQSMDEVRLFNQDEEKLAEIMKLQKEAFYSLSNNQPVIYCSGPDEVDKYIRKLSKKYSTMVKSFNKKNSRDLPDRMPPYNFPPLFEEEPLLLFFDTKMGITIIGQYNEIISDPNNKFYNPNAFVGDMLRLVREEKPNGEFITWLVENNYLPAIAFKGVDGEKLVKESLDFLMRYYKKDEYFPKSSIVLK